MPWTDVCSKLFRAYFPRKLLLNFFGLNHPEFVLTILVEIFPVVEAKIELATVLHATFAIEPLRFSAVNFFSPVK